MHDEDVTDLLDEFSENIESMLYREHPYDERTIGDNAISMERQVSVQLNVDDVDFNKSEILERIQTGEASVVEINALLRSDEGFSDDAKYQIQKYIDEISDELDQNE